MRGPAPVPRIVWETADKFLRDVVEEDYGDYILPFTVLRRLECTLAETKDEVTTSDNESRGSCLPQSVGGLR